MAGEVFLKQNGSGVLTETIAVQVGGTGKENKLCALDATGRIALTTLPEGMYPDTKSAVISGTLEDGDFVNLFNDGGTLKARKADATDETKLAQGFVLVGGSVDETCLVYFEGTDTACADRTVGAQQYLDVGANAGKPTELAPIAEGNVVQKLGVALAATEVNLEIGRAIIVEISNVTAVSDGISTALGTTTVTLGHIIVGLSTDDIVVKVDTVAIDLGDDYTVGTIGLTFGVTFLAGAALDSESVVTIEVTKTGHIINNGNAIAVVNTIP